MITPLEPLADSTQTSRLGILHLKRYWAKAMANRQGQLASDLIEAEWNLDVTLLSALGLGLEQTIRYLYATNPSFAEFEDWILTTTGGPTANKLSSFNELILGRSSPVTQDAGPILSADDLAHWDAQGYVIVRNAVSRAHCEETIQLICEFLDIERYNPHTWYRPNPAWQGIMVQLFQHPRLTSNRESSRIRLAYEQLWKRTDLWVTSDRVGFNPPQTVDWHFPGPHLHWDVSLDLPIPYGLQGLLYLSDTAANQGAFTLVPGFQHRIGDWLASLPAGANPRTQDLQGLGAIPLSASAGDFIIWQQALPHGSSPNMANEPRFVQYINYAPADVETRSVWK
ncbi:phytanoyl-CoA dioxygenase family protein [Spirosoma validum]|uniref:Phytanoyl-CoA dioxygenase family protein n=1 Tax=Spirosoma validum TaxID=2771355 RepID=A0A927GBS8_9BACT|nr:phytanoyl-CoA dioxygenase family protein [Spirosoma validum]MBD2751928.1 phytanoyl-CoA dioxygenase family protein [Spirosoma validum]